MSMLCAATVAGWVSAVVVGNNGTLDPSLTPLRYADDDAVRTYEFLGASVDSVRLLTVADEDTQERHPGIGARSVAPTRAELTRALDAAFDEIRREKEGGHPTTFYFFFSGHGSIGEGRETWVHLADGPLTRADLYREIIAKSPADRNHIVIDACNAYFLVHKRGEEEAMAAVRRLVEAEDLARYPQTGVFLSTSSATDAQEWDRYGAGVFSHVLRSALAGAADVDGDRKITYDEAEAFFRAAVSMIPDARARPVPLVQAPALDRQTPLIDLTRGRFGAWLRLSEADAGRYWLIDDRNVRVVDFNKAAGHVMSLALPGPRRYFVNGSGKEATLDVPAPLALRPGFPWGDLAFTEQQAATRGAPEALLQKFLFAQDYGPAFYRGFMVSRSAVPVVEPPKPGSIAPLFAFGASAIATATWAYLGWSIVGDPRSSDVQDRVLGANISGGVAVTTLLAGVGLLLLGSP